MISHRSFRLIQRLKIHRFSSSLPESSPQAHLSNDRRSDLSLTDVVICGMVTATAAGLSFAYLYPHCDTRFAFFELLKRESMFFHERHLRLQRPPEKVFEYFASVRTPEGELLMKPADLMRAIVPVFPSSESDLAREGYLTGERNLDSEFFMQFGVDNDGLISFKEFLFFVTLLSFPESSFTEAFKMFDADNDGEIDKEEFKAMMSLMRSKHGQGIFRRDDLQTGLKMFSSDGGLVEFFFGKDDRKKLKHDKFIQFIRYLTEEMFRLEFAHYDYKRKGSISAKDFALSIAAAADLPDFEFLYIRVNKVNDEPHLKEIRISLKELKQFDELRSKIVPLSVALFADGKPNDLLTMEHFKQAASKVCGVAFSDNVIEIVFHMFGSNKDGNLAVDKLLRFIGSGSRNVFQTHFYNGVQYPRVWPFPLMGY